jgi:hypothetical protein
LETSGEAIGAFGMTTGAAAAGATVPTMNVNASAWHMADENLNIM